MNILRLLIVGIVFVQSNAFCVKEKHNLSSFLNLEKKLEELHINASTTLFVFDIDQTLVTEDQLLFNPEFCREQLVQGKKIANILNVNVSEFYNNIMKLRDTKRWHYEFVEDSISDVMKRLQNHYYMTTCTASQFYTDRFDPRLDLMRINGIDFAKTFDSEVFKNELLPFYDGPKEHKFNYRGQISSFNTEKSVKINFLLMIMNFVLENKGLKKIDTLIFVDNAEEQVSKILKQINQVENVYSFHYTYLKDNADVDELVDSYKTYYRMKPIIINPKTSPVENTYAYDNYSTVFSDKKENNIDISNVFEELNQHDFNNEFDQESVDKLYEQFLSEFENDSKHSTSNEGSKRKFDLVSNLIDDPITSENYIDISVLSEEFSSSESSLKHRKLG